MFVGTAQVDITPAPGIELSGFVARVQPSLGVHDPLHARALYVSDGTHRLLWLHCDLVGLTRELVGAVKAQLRAGHGLEPHQVVLSATHTHSGPATVHLLNCGACDPVYVRWLETRLLDAAAVALGETTPADLCVAEGRCTLGCDRRGKSRQHTDSRVGVVGWRRADGMFAAVLANYAMHNVALGHENRLISADIAGAAAHRTAHLLPGRPVVLLTNGGAGNINPPAVANDVLQMERWGGDLGDALVAAATEARPVPDAVVASAARSVDLPLRRLTEEQIAEIADRHRGYTRGQTDYAARRCREVFDYWQRHMGIVVHDLPSPVAPLAVQVVALGPVVLACFSAEMFSVTADDLRADTQRAVYAVSYANGVLGYLPPEYAVDEGGYEVGGAHIFYDSLPLAREAYAQARAAAVELIGEVRPR